MKLGKRLLLVDDNADFLDSTRDVLEEAGYSVTTAANGEEALSAGSDCTFDLILMDIKMPGIDGVETFIRIKDRCPGTKAILFTAFTMDNLIGRALSEGVLEVLSKPIDMARLIRMIQTATKFDSGNAVLLIDDDREFCESLADALKDNGYVVTVNHEGVDGVETLRKQPFDFLLLDMKLPGMSALDIHHEAKKVQPHISTIIVTGYANEYRNVLDQAVVEDVDSYLVKPLEIKTLLMLFEQVKWKKSQTP